MTNTETYKQSYLQLLHSYYPLPDRIFTEDSKTEEGVAEAAVYTEQIHKPYTCRPTDDSSVFTGGPLPLRHVYQSNVTECICTFVFVLLCCCIMCVALSVSFVCVRHSIFYVCVTCCDLDVTVRLNEREREKTRGNNSGL